MLKVGDTLLVADVGGGTTDFTLIGVTEENGTLNLNRIAVGSHTLVGGDNMDLALAHFASTAFAAKNVTLDPWQSVALWHSCRAAKETLLAEGGPAKQAVVGPGPRPKGDRRAQSRPTWNATRSSNCLSMAFSRRARYPTSRSDSGPAGSARSGCRSRRMPPSPATSPRS